MNRKFLFLLIVFLTVLFSNCAGSQYQLFSKADAVDAGPSVSKKYSPRESVNLQVEQSKEESLKREDRPSPTEPAAKRMVIYTGNIQIQVIDPNSSYQKLSELVKAQGGFVENTNFQNQGRRIVAVLRVPVAKFFNLMDSLPELGLVLYRSIQANDITNEFADVENRLKSARLLKERLEKLLVSIKDVEEKVKILREINRLGSEIEALSDRRKVLSDRSSMATVTVQLLAEARSTDGIESQSPFGFIRGLNPAKRSIEKLSSLTSVKPTGFFDNTDNFKDGATPYQYYSANGTILRSGEVENRPTGDSVFWKKAFQIEFTDNRGYKEVNNSKITDGFLYVYRVHDGLNVYYYGISYRVVDNKVHLFEAFSPNQDSYTKDGSKMIEFLKSIGGPL